MSLAFELAAIESRISALDPQPAARAALSPAAASDFAALLPGELSAATTAMPAANTAQVDALIDGSASRYGVDPALVRAVVTQESGYDRYATSPTGAQGLMQLEPGTASDLGVTDPYDAAQNIDGGTRYLRQLLDRFGGDTRRAVAAYNAGPGAVERYDGVPPYAETERYVANVLSGYASRIART